MFAYARQRGAWASLLSYLTVHWSVPPGNLIDGRFARAYFRARLIQPQIGLRV